jgi:DNA-binding NarL/FixJ family response regulator
MKVLIADSNFISLNGLRAILSNEKNLIITGEARNEHELMDHIKLFRLMLWLLITPRMVFL